MGSATELVTRTGAKLPNPANANSLAGVNKSVAVLVLPSGVRVPLKLESVLLPLPKA